MKETSTQELRDKISQLETDYKALNLAFNATSTAINLLIVAGHLKDEKYQQALDLAKTF